MSSAWVMDYLGKPWINGASGPDAFDCWGLVRHIYRERLDIDLPAVDVDAHRPLAVRHAFAEGAKAHGWEEVEACPEADFDVVLMGQAKHPHHVGLAVAGGILHSVEGIGVIYQDTASLRRHGWRLLAAYRRSA